MSPTPPFYEHPLGEREEECEGCLLPKSECECHTEHEPADDPECEDCGQPVTECTCDEDEDDESTYDTDFLRSPDDSDED